MDTARRWQVVSVATAIAGLGVGSLLVGRTPSTEIGPIDLDLVVASTASDDLLVRDRPLSGSEIVPPVIREDHLEVPARSAPAASTRNPAGNPEVISLDTPVASLASPAAPAPAPAPIRPVDSDDGPESDDSVDSADD
jgi:hypothetical protein